MPRSSTTFLLALALVPASAGCCGDCLETAVAEIVQTPQPTLAAGISTLNGFVENKGQWPDEVLFFARRGGVEATVLRDALVFRPMPPSADAPAPAPLVFHLPGDAAGRTVEGLDRLVTKHHFLLGERQASDAAGFERVALRDVLPGVDIVLRADGGGFEYDLALEPGASLYDLVLEIEGAGGLEIRGADTLVLHTDAGEVEQRIRASWQGDAREPVACRFRALEAQAGRQRFGFEAPRWDRALALVLDPSLVYLTYVGGSGQETLIEAEVDSAGAVYLLAKSTGGTPVTPGSLQETSTFAEAWIGKLAPDGSTLEWGTFLGGSHTDEPKDLALDADGSVVVVGMTWSPNFPVTPGAYKEQIGAGGITKSDVFISRLDASGSFLEWSTFYGGETSEIAHACALYPGGDVLVAFEPLSADPPSTLGVIDEVFNPGDLALSRLSADGKQRLFQTYFRASTIDDVVIDEGSLTYLVGSVLSQDAPLMTTPGALKEILTPGDSDGFVTKLNAGGTQLVWSTYLGGEPNAGSGLDRAYAIAIDASKAVYVAGYTHSDTFPVTTGAFQSVVDKGTTEGFAAKLVPNGSSLAWATYIAAWGFPGFTQVNDIKVDQAGSAILFGQANEPDFPVTPDAFQPVFIGGLFANTDTLLCKLDVIGESLLYATWFGGNGSDSACELAVGTGGDAHLAFQAFSSDLPVTGGAFQSSYAGSGDLATARFDFGVLPWTILDGGLAGAAAPVLAGLGELSGGSATRLALRGASPATPAWLVAGVFQIDLPFLGGSLVPFPTIVLPWTTDLQGEVDFSFPWPPAPVGTTVFFQTWALDAGAIQGWSASNGLKAVCL